MSAREADFPFELDEPQPLMVWDRLPTTLTWKEKVAYLGVQFLKLPQVPCPVEHVIGHGTYIRKMKIPAGTLFLGREHLKGHEVTLLKGSVILVSPTGRRHFDAVKTIHTSPGTHVVCYTLTDVEAQTCHPNPTNSMDIETLEAEIFESKESLAELGRLVEQRLLT